jgi:hypothetical protein
LNTTVTCARMLSAHCPHGGRAAYPGGTRRSHGGQGGGRSHLPLRHQHLCDVSTPQKETRQSMAHLGTIDDGLGTVDISSLPSDKSMI